MLSEQDKQWIKDYVNGQIGLLVLMLGIYVVLGLVAVWLSR